MSILKYIFKKNSLKRKIFDVRDDIKTIVSDYSLEKFDVLYYGAYDIDPKNLVYWICIETDSQKQSLENDFELNTKLRSLLDKHKYPEQAKKHVYISFESQETVERESKGDWHHHFQ